MLPTPLILSLLPPDMKSAASDLDSIISMPPPNLSPSLFFASLNTIEIPDKSKPASLRRVPKRKASDPSQANSQSYIKYYLPDFQSPNKNVKKGGVIKELANSVERVSKKTKKKKNSDLFGLKTSYRKMTVLHNLESHVESHFILNHKYKILMFGCVGSVGAHISDDEGTENRNGNPLYNIDIVNQKFDELADEDILSDIQITQYLQSIVQDHQKVQQLRKSSILNPALLNSLLEDRHLFLNKLFEYTDELNICPIVYPIRFDCTKTDSVPYPEYISILSILMNIEDASRSLRIGSEIRSNLYAYRFLVRRALASKDLKYHLVCDPVIAKYLFATHNIINSIWRTFMLPQNWQFTLFMKFFMEKKIFLSDILDELTMSLGKSIDTGSWYSREMLKYRELACITDLFLFSAMVHEECDLYKTASFDVDRLVEIARGFTSYNQMVGVKFVFSKFGVSLTQELVENVEHTHLFPVFNMFDGIYSLDNESLASVVY